MPESAPHPETRRRSSRLLRLKGVGLAIVLLAVTAACLRFELSASASAPPSPEWREKLFTHAGPLQNVPVVMSTVSHVDGITVTVANEGTTTLIYYATGRSGIELFQEFEEMGEWTTASWDWCGTWKDEYRLAPGKQVELAVHFSDARRERVLAYFTENDTNRMGMLVLAAEDGRVGLNVEMMILFSGFAFAAFCIWLAVRIANRRERWAMWTSAGLVVVVVGYPLGLVPIVCLDNRDMISYDGTVGKIISAYRAPASWLQENGPPWIREALNGAFRQQSKGLVPPPM